jgi:purine-binding chemotaxis protein CheW
MTMEPVHVTVRIGRESYALPIENVREVAEIDDLTAVPGAGDHVLGVSNLHGQVMTVVDLAQVLGIAGGGTTRRVVVTDRAGSLAGLAVDEVAGVAALPPGVEHTDSGLLSHAVLDGDTLVGVIDIDNLYAALGDAS